MARTRVRWLEEVADKDYGAAMRYLTLLMPESEAKRVLKRLRKTAVVEEWVAKDILRAARLPVLSAEESPEVRTKIEKVEKGKAISPVLLVSRPELAGLIVADGYHRICCALHFDEATVVPCRLVHL